MSGHTYIHTHTYTHTHTHTHTKSKVKSVIDTPVTGGNTMPRTNIVQRRVHTKLYEVANNKQ